VARFGGHRRFACTPATRVTRLPAVPRLRAASDRLGSAVVADAVFVPQPDGRLLATPLSRGPWDPAAQHGGAPAALLARAIERHEGGEGMRVARLTVELLRPVPIASLSVEVETLKPGRRVQLFGASLRDGGTEVCRATGLRVRSSPGETEPVAPAEVEPPPPGSSRAGGRPPSGERPTFGGDAMEVRYAAGDWRDLGPAVAWLRLRVPLVEGEEASPLQRAVAAADFGNGVSATLDWGSSVFVNPDLTVHLDRDPVGEWICLDAVTRICSDGTGSAESVLRDERGRVGRAVQALLVSSL